MSPSSFQPSFYRFALKLPDSAAVRLLRLLAAEIFRQLGGEIIEDHLQAYADIVTHWRAGGDDSPGLREAMRAMGARERGVAKLEKLREQAWLQARAEVFQQTGEGIPLPQTPEAARRGEGTRIMRQLSQQFDDLKALAEKAGTGGKVGTAAGEAPAPLTPAPRTDAPRTATSSGADPAAAEPPTRKQVKVALQRLISAQVDRKTVEALRSEALSGQMSKADFVRRVEELLGIQQAA